MNARGVFLTALFLIAGMSILVGSFGLRERFSQGTRARREICLEISVVKEILYNEHRAKLRNALRFQRERPNGIPSIGVTSRDLLENVILERKIVAETRPKPCP